MTTTPVTGGLGGVGSWTVDELADRGHGVVALDPRTPKQTRENVDFEAGNLTGYGETRRLAEAAEPDAVVRLAAIPNPESHAGSRVFEKQRRQHVHRVRRRGRGRREVRP